MASVGSLGKIIGLGMPPKNKKASASAAKKCDLCTGVIKNAVANVPVPGMEI